MLMEPNRKIKLSKQYPMWDSMIMVIGDGPQKLDNVLSSKSAKIERS
jgi:hypothetical protein